MKFEISVEWTEAFDKNGPATELLGILKKLADEVVAYGPDYLQLKDSEGKNAGSFRVVRT